MDGKCGAGRILREIWWTKWGGDYLLVLDIKMVICGVGYFEKIEDNRILVIT